MTAAETDALAAELRRRGLAAPARLLIEAHRPLRPLFGDLATFLTPVLGPLLGARSAAVNAVLDDDAGIDHLLQQLSDEDER
jgi:hypothetical protein